MAEYERRMLERKASGGAVILGVSSQYDPGLYFLRDQLQGLRIGAMTSNGSTETWALVNGQNPPSQTATPYVPAGPNHVGVLHSECQGVAIPPADLDNQVAEAFDLISVAVMPNAQLQAGNGGAASNNPRMFEEGVYAVRQNGGNVVVGDLVLEAASAALRVQHWFLYVNQRVGTGPYTWPGPGAPLVTNQLSYTRSYTRNYLLGTPARLAQRGIQYVYLRAEESYQGSFPAS